MKTSFPPEINLSDPKLRKLREYLDFRYSNYSEVTVMSNTVKNWPTISSWYNKSTWSRKDVQQRLRELVEACCIEVIPSDYYPVLPESVYRHVVSRIGAYRLAKLERQHHWCLNGSEPRGLAGHFFLIGLAGNIPINIKREVIYRLWRKCSQNDLWADSLRSVGEHWKYGRIFERIGTRNVRIEIWFDTRLWRPLGKLADKFDEELTKFMANKKQNRP